VPRPRAKLAAGPCRKPPIATEVPMALHIYRVTVRGFFTELDPDVRARLLDEADEHDALRAAFTEDGTFTYGRALDAFSFRYQLRVRLDDEDDDRALADATAERAGLDRATAALEAAGITAKRLRVSVTDMADVWAGDDRR
jgi:hypothetical protein